MHHIKTRLICNFLFFILFSAFFSLFSVFVSDPCFSESRIISSPLFQQHTNLQSPEHESPGTNLLYIAVSPFGGGYHSYSSVGESLRSVLMNGLAATGRFAVLGVTYFDQAKTDIIISGNISHLDISGIDHYHTGSVNRMGIPVREYSHTTYTADMYVDFAVTRANSSRLIKKGSVNVSSTDTDYDHNDFSYRYNYYKRPGGRRHGFFNYSYNSYHSSSNRLISSLIYDAAVNSNNSIIQNIKDLFPLRGKVVKESIAQKDMVWINLGSDQGINLRDRFLVFQGTEEIAILRINQVEKTAARGKLFRTRNHPNIKVIPGHRVVSRGY